MRANPPNRPGALIRVATWSIDHRRLVVPLWIVLLVALTAVAGRAGGEYGMEFATPGAESDAARQLLEDHFPAEAGDEVDVVFRATGDDGIDDPAVQADVEAFLDEALALPRIDGVRSPYGETGAFQVSPDRTIAFAALQLEGGADDAPAALGERLAELADEHDRDGLTFEVGGFLIEKAQQGEIGSEGIGLLVASFILLLTFGSVLAMGLPILVAVVGLGISAAITLLIARVLDVPEFAPMLASMIGIGVGIDYVLFIVTRYRTELAAGRQPREANVVALATAGRAVLFAGCTVIISLLGMFAMGLEFLNGLALAAASGVLVVMVASVTLLPAILGFVGRRIDMLRVPFVGRRSARDHRGIWYRWSRFVQRRPWPAVVGGLVLIVALATQLTHIRFGFPDAGNGARELTTRRAYDLLAEGFGDGFNGPLIAVVGDGETQVRDADVEATIEAIGATDGVAAVVPFAFEAPDGTVSIVRAFPTTSPQEQATEDLVHRLRSEVLPAADVDAPVAFTGETAASVDVNDYMAGRLPWFIGSVVLLSFVLLMTVFRSVLIAVKASVMNVLSIAAAYGVVGLAINGGPLGDLIGIQEPVPLPSFIPMMMFAILFGLSMDYEVFLLSRVREEYVRTGDNATAVADGLAATARVITAAAAIMVAVFLAFVLNDDVFVKAVGIGLAAAILIDATVVRMVLVPSTMELLGDRNWWLPKWLDRILPDVHVEGEEAAAHAVAGSTADTGDDTDRELVGV